MLHVDALRLRQGLRDQGALMVAGSWRRWWGPGLGAGRGGRRRRGSLLVCVRLCGRASTIPSSTVPQIVHRQWLVIPAETGTHSANCAADRRDSSGAVLGLVLDMPLLCNVGAQFACQGRRHLCRGADADSFGPSGESRKIIEILQLQSIDKVVDVCCAGPAVLGCRR